MLEYLYYQMSSLWLGILALTLVLAYVIRSLLNHPSDLPPIPCRPLPIFGHLFFFKPTLGEALLRWKKELGDIYSFYRGNQLVVVMCNHALVNEALVKQGDKFSERPQHVLNHKWEENSYGIVNNNNSWKEQRTASMAILRNFGMGKNWLADKINEEVDGYIKALADLKGEATNIRVLTIMAVSNVICAILLGKRFPYDDAFLQSLVDYNSEQLRFATKTSVIAALPWLRHLPGDMFGIKEWINLKFHLSDIFSKKFIKVFRDDADDTTTDNFIKAYLREMYKLAKSNRTNHLSEKHLSRIIETLFIAGGDTTTTTILWAMAFSLHYPECQKKAYEEILEEVGTERSPNIQDKPKLKYVNAFILETQRLASVVPLGVLHKCTRTTQVGGYRIPEGTTILTYLDAILKDEKVWKDTRTFRPERFLSEDGNVTIPNEFVPFSMGRRMCLGESLAKMELFLFLSNVLQRFEILPEESSNLPPLEPAKKSMMSALNPFKLRLKERQRL